MKLLEPLRNRLPAPPPDHEEPIEVSGKPAAPREHHPRIIRMVVPVLFRLLRLFPGDEEILVRYFYWARERKLRTQATLREEPLMALLAIEHGAAGEWLTLLKVRLILGPLRRFSFNHPLIYDARDILRALWRPMRRGLASTKVLARRLRTIFIRTNLSLDQTRWGRVLAFLAQVYRLRGGKRWRLFSAFGAAALALAERYPPLHQTIRLARRGIRVPLLYVSARSIAYDLLLKNRDLDGAAWAFETLSRLQFTTGRDFSSDSRWRYEERKLDRLMFLLVPLLRDIERKRSETTCGTPQKRTLVISMTACSSSDVEQLIRYCLPSLLARGNLPALIDDVDVVCHFLATATSRMRIAQDDTFTQIAALCRCVFDEIPDEIVSVAQETSNWSWLCRLLPQLSIHLATRLDADLHVAHPGTLYSERFFTGIYRVAGEKKINLVIGSSIRAFGDSIYSALQDLKSDDGSISLASRELHSLALEHIHPSCRALFASDKELINGAIAAVGSCFWCEQDSIVMHTTERQPLFIGHDLVSGIRTLFDRTAIGPLLESGEAAVHTACPEDEIGYVTIDDTQPTEDRTMSARDMAERVWPGYTDAEFAFFQQELKLPIADIPTDIPCSPLGWTRRAFAALITISRKVQELAEAKRSLRVVDEIFKVSGPVSDAPAVVSGRISALNLLRMASTLLELERRHGAGSETEYMIASMRTLVRGSTIVDAWNSRLTDALLSALLRIGLLEEVALLRERQSFSTGHSFGPFIDFCWSEYQSAESQGKAWRDSAPNEDLFVLSGVVWGDTYIRNFMEFTLRSMLAPGNLPALSQQGECKFVIVTDEAGRAAIQSHPMYLEASRYASWHISVVPKLLIKLLTLPDRTHFYQRYGMLDHVGAFFAEGARAHLFLIPVDAVVANGSLVAMADCRFEGFECCGGGNTVAESDTFLPALAAQFPGQAPITLSASDLASLALQSPHVHFSSQVVCVENRSFGKYPRELFWPVRGGIQIHSCFIHPLFTAADAVQRYRNKHLANIDYGMIPRIFADPDRIKILDPAKAYINNFSYRAQTYQTTSRPFRYQDFIRAHSYTYSVQKRLFAQSQFLPCSYSGMTAYRSVTRDVGVICEAFRSQYEHSDTPREVTSLVA